jgi:hypothetical protein
MATEGQGQLQTSEIEGVEGVGDDFMQAVFENTAGDVCVAVNQPRDTVCVVRVKTDRPSQEELRQKFKSSLTGGAQPGVPREVELLAAAEAFKYYASWLDGFDKQMQVDWKRNPLPGTEAEI